MLFKNHIERASVFFYKIKLSLENKNCFLEEARFLINNSRKKKIFSAKKKKIVNDLLELIDRFGNHRNAFV